MQGLQPWRHCARVVVGLAVDLVRFLKATLRSQAALAAENLFLRKQLALYRERHVKPRRASDPLRLALVLLARCFPWREALIIVQPATLVRLSPCLALAVAARPATAAGGVAAAGLRDGARQPDLGRGADCDGVAPQARAPGVTAHGAEGRRRRSVPSQ
jgi:hypothetical protein